MRLPSVASARSSAQKTARRFPVSLSCSILFTCAALVATRSQGMLLPELSRYLYLLFCACFGYIALTLVVERGGVSRAKAFATGTALLALLAYYVFSSAAVIDLACLAGAAVLLMFVAPYLRHTAGNDSMWTFCYRLSTHIAFTFLTAVVLYLGGIMIIGSVSYLLLGNRVPGDMYFYYWIVIACFFSPLLAMSGIPERFDDAEETYPKFLRILLIYIVLPLWAAYIAVLYLYMLKILFLMRLPDGQVGYFVSIFGAVTIGIYLKGYPLFRQGATGLARTYNRVGFPLLIAPLILLALSLARRIHAYGITEDRYLVGISLLWLTCCIAIKYLDDTKAPRRMLLSGIALLVLSAFGPWGMSAVSTQSQYSRLMNLLEANHLLVEGQAVKSAMPLPFKEQATLSGNIDYFVESNREEYLRPLFKADENSPFICKEKCASEYAYQHQGNLKKRFAEAIGITYLSPWERRNDANAIKIKNFNFKTKNLAYDVNGYELAVPLNFPFWDGNQQDRWASKPVALESSRPAQTVSFNCSVNTVMCRVTGNAIPEGITFDLTPLLNSQAWNEGNTPVEADEPHYLLAESNDYAAKLVLMNYTGNFRLKGNAPTLGMLHGLLLLKAKHD